MNVDAAYRIAWKVLPHVPEGLVVGFSRVVADIVYLAGGKSVKQLRRNYEQFLGVPVSNLQVRDGVRSYFRSFAQQLTLPGWSKERIRRGCVYVGAPEVAELMKRGPVVLALTHSGNWDLAGAWFCQEFGPILTVAEKLEPEVLFDLFVHFRESIGMEIIGVAKGEKVFDRVVECAKGRSLLVPLLADRDISGSGIEVTLGASKALVAAGPAALALRLNRPLIAGHISYRKIGGEWQICAHFTDPILPPNPDGEQNVTEAFTRAWVSTIAPKMRKHVVDWHMMQKVFVADLDLNRLRRARQRHKEKMVN